MKKEFLRSLMRNPVAGFLLSVVLAGAAPQVVQAEEDNFSLTGEIREHLAMDMQNDLPNEDQFANHLEIIAGHRFDLDDDLYLQAEGKINSFYYDQRDFEKADLRLHNFFLDYGQEKYDLRVGNQIVTWGKSDELSAIDIVNPEDMRRGLVRSRTERKIPIPMINLRYFEEENEGQVVLIPFFKGHEFDFDDTDWAAFGNIQSDLPGFRLSRDKPDSSLANAELGLRFTSTVDSTDYGISYFHGRDDMPGVSTMSAPEGFSIRGLEATSEDLARYSVATMQDLPLTNLRQNILGLEFETTDGEFGIRGDMALIDRRQFLSADGIRPLEKPVVQYVVGADYSTVTDVYFNLQFSQQYIQNYTDDILYFKEFTNGIWFNFAKTFSETELKFDLYYYRDFSRSSDYLSPRFVSTYWENLEIQFGLDIIGGPRDSSLGFYRHNDQVFVALDADF
ncbi:MAG: hypothetical protein PHC51_01190 [bacterium]|nr:hypothetical protein [bacterium]